MVPLSEVEKPRRSGVKGVEKFSNAGYRIVCLFARSVYTGKTIEKALKALGYDINEQTLVDLGKQIYLVKHKIKVLEGFKPDGLRIPRRFLETPTPLGQVSEEYLRKIIAHYAKLVSKNSGYG